jgi:hypothetical protein
MLLGGVPYHTEAVALQQRLVQRCCKSVRVSA